MQHRKRVAAWKDELAWRSQSAGEVLCYAIAVRAKVPCLSLHLHHLLGPMPAGVPRTGEPLWGGGTLRWAGPS
jgi:hypothetical protein